MPAQSCDLQDGIRHARSGTFARAVPRLHAATWQAGRGDGPRQRLDVQLKLADAQLQARDFAAALASYRFAERLAGEVVPDSADYWVVRASIAQALRRNGQCTAAAAECRAVLERLDRGGLAPPDGRAGLARRMALGLTAQLAASRGAFAAAIEDALRLAELFRGDGDSLRAANQLFNAAQWLLCAADHAGAAWPSLAERASAEQARAGELLKAAARGPGNDLETELALLPVLADLVTAKHQAPGADPAAASAVLTRAGRALDAIEAASPDLPASLRFEVATLRLRLAERGLGDVDSAGAVLADLLARHRGVAILWARQDVSARFRWDRALIPLGDPDPDLERLLAGSQG